MSKIVLFVSDVADILNFSKERTYTLFARQDFPSMLIANRYCIRIDRFCDWLNHYAEKEAHNAKQKNCKP